MKAVVQRVSEASVAVAGETIGSIGEGIVVLVGAEEGDGPADAAALASKVVGLRIFADEDGRMNRSVVDAGGAALVISQFTLLGDVRRGRRPSFTSAAPPEVAEPLVDEVAERIAAGGVPVATGSFGAAMSVQLVNEGPVTILLETHQGRVV